MIVPLGAEKTLPPSIYGFNVVKLEFFRGKTSNESALSQNEKERGKDRERGRHT